MVLYLGANLLLVSTHELGHTLGLAHSGEPGAIMTPYYSTYSPLLQLGKDDIDGIQYLYGMNFGRYTGIGNALSELN